MVMPINELNRDNILYHFRNKCSYYNKSKGYIFDGNIDILYVIVDFICDVRRWIVYDTTQMLMNSSVISHMLHTIHKMNID